ncbi:MAG: neutral/alkaline non-lysosomal ceramidase N-terminal domain-containing protein, partial [Solirubrobacterales bacterium]|nr:neutral/alkaline non-lysosomal ceramidase N-terminal domain-containing protein [Solirubrobacterales bacterium]
MHPRRWLALSVLALAAAAPASAQAGSTSGQLRAGAGQADITPPKTGYYLGGWTRADRLAKGQSTRLYANTLVLQRGTQKVALVSVELFSVAAGLQEDVAREVADLGFDQSTVLLAASHTHSGPGGFSNNPTYNTAAPSVETIGDPNSFVEFFDPKPADPQLYTFLVKQIAASIRRAHADRGLAEAAWGHSRLTDVTDNRSIEAHLANYGIDVPTGQGSADMAPGGRISTIDPTVDVLRVDKVRKSKKKGGKARRIPIGAYSNFADHGTVVKSETELYSGDHHAAAWRLFVDRLRKSRDIPRRQTVVNVYPNGAEGDQSAGLRHTGVAGAVEVGQKEADAMFEAWQDAESKLSRTPPLDVRWTRTCFCGRDTATGPVDSKGVVGAGFLTGSEEGRGPLFDLTGVSFEGRTSPVDDPVQGRKIQVPVASPPPATIVSVLRIGDGALATIPGEPTKQVGVHVREAVLKELAGSGVKTITIAGLAQDFIQYITTAAEYGTQSYEGASTLYGKNQATFLQERLAELARTMAAGTPAPEPFPLDTSYGVKPDGPAFGPGAASGTITQEPAESVQRMAKVDLAWTGGPDGVDRPV